jgi:hypothetical protein
MNKYSLRDFLYEKFSSYISTLKDTSFDSENSIYLCNDTSTSNVYDFDKYVKSNFDTSRLPSSPDAIYLGNKKLYFIEFKNQIPSAITTSEIKSKFHKGTTILKEILKEFTPRDVEYIFCVVFKNSGSTYFDSSHIESNITRFGLKEKNKELGSFYSEIITENVKFYKSNFSSLNCQ